MELREYQYWLNGIDGIGAVRVHQLLQNLGDARSIYQAGRQEWEKVLGKRTKLLDCIENSRDAERIHREYEQMQAKGIRMILDNEEDYPEGLRRVHDNPNAIFVRGQLPSTERISIGIVGARECSDYGRLQAEGLARELSGLGIQIISGMARGIDGASHRGALQGKTPTFAVLGNGVDICYPQSHIELQRQLLNQGGGLISEFLPGTKPLPRNFPMRNRLLSALCDGLLVVEAREQSGSLITVSMALEQGVDVFAIPGRVYDGLSVGCNRLIQQGANLVIDAYDILEYFKFEQHKIATKNKKCEIMLETNEKMLYDCLSLEPLHIDAIVAKSGFTIPDAIELLWNLEGRHLICQVRQNYYARKPESKGE